MQQLQKVSYISGFVCLVNRKAFIQTMQNNLVVQKLKDLCDRFGIQHSFSSPFYPQGNGKVERTIYTMKDMLYCTVKEKERTWSKILWEVEMCF